MKIITVLLAVVLAICVATITISYPTIGEYLNVSHSLDHTPVFTLVIFPTLYFCIGYLLTQMMSAMVHLVNKKTARTLLWIGVSGLTIYFCMAVSFLTDISAINELIAWLLYRGLIFFFVSGGFIYLGLDSRA